jgi:hypothetical protein
MSEIATESIPASDARSTDCLDIDPCRSYGMGYESIVNSRRHGVNTIKAVSSLFGNHQTLADS